MKYKQLTITTTSQFSELAAFVMSEVGSEGVTICDKDELKTELKTTYWDYIDENFFESLPQSVLVAGFFDVNFDQAVLIDALNDVKSRSCFDTGSLEITSQIIDSSDWENVWKKYYKPMKIGKLAIIPLWLKNPFKDAIEVLINPGMAFGTGNHETTQMCIKLMQETQISGMRVADVGCGSGILGVCALKQNAESCTFVDMDENAVIATKENCTANDVLGNSNIVLGNLLASESEKFDVILANLTADLLVELYPQLSNCLKNDGKIVISGIISPYLDKVLDVYLKGFSLIKTESQNDWRALLLTKNGEKA